MVNSTVTDTVVLRGTQTATVNAYGGSLWMEGSSLERNNAPAQLRLHDNVTSTIASDPPVDILTQVAARSEDSHGEEHTLVYARATRFPPPTFEFLKDTNEWFELMKQVRVRYMNSDTTLNSQRCQQRAPRPQASLPVPITH